MAHDSRPLTGFGSYFESEAIPGSLPQGRNAPQRPPMGLYAEQLSGSAFTAPRAENWRSWLYRIRPSAGHSAFEAYAHLTCTDSPSKPSPIGPTQLRWDPRPMPKTPTDFVDGLFTVAGNGSAAERTGCAVHLYAANRSMERRFFANSDGELLLVPQRGALRIATELGELSVKPGWIAVLPRGMKFQVLLEEKEAAGYVCENFGAPFRLPGLGPIGANGLANPRDFEAPQAAFRDSDEKCEVIVKYDGGFFRTELDHDPLDVVAWHGNYVPYRYDLSRFNTIGTVSFDHPDPSIFTVLTSPTDREGTANVDFVIFPPRWMVATDTFRPPYYHRNTMSEFMGLVHGAYDAKEEGFLPGGSSLHNCMSAHGPDREAFDKATAANLEPKYMENTLAFMFESVRVFRPTTQSLEVAFLQKNYLDCWKGLQKHFRR